MCIRASPEGPVLASPTTVINAAVLHWADEMQGLLRLIPTMQGQNVGNRAFLESRLELWAMKAVEDWLLVHLRKGGMSWPL